MLPQDLSGEFRSHAKTVRVFSANPDGTVTQGFQSLAQRAAKKAALSAGMRRSGPAMGGTTLGG